VKGLLEILLVDGYNIINAWPELKKTAEYSLEDARQQLLDIMQDFQGYKGYRIIVVFDAHMIKGGIEKKETAGKVEVVYTRENETADHYIERWTDGIQKNMRVMVATSDFLQQTIVMSRGAVRISARELLDQVRAFQKEIGSEYLEKPKPKSNTLSDWASPEIIEVLERWRRQR
jgi:predicted RNA-binding protein with PIN domain